MYARATNFENFITSQIAGLSSKIFPSHCLHSRYRKYNSKNKSCGTSCIKVYYDNRIRRFSRYLLIASTVLQMHKFPISHDIQFAIKDYIACKYTNNEVYVRVCMRVCISLFFSLCGYVRPYIFFVESFECT